MAKNYTIGEVAEIINAGTDINEIMDIGRRFPVLSCLMTRIVAKSNDPDGLVTFFKAFPEYVNASKINKALKESLSGVIVETTEDVDDEETPSGQEAPAPAKKAKKAKPATVEEDEDEDEDEDDEYAGKSATELYKMCKKAGLKVPPKKDEAFYIEQLKAASEDVDEDEDEEEEAPAKPAKKAKKPAKKEEAEDEDDDWDI